MKSFEDLNLASQVSRGLADQKFQQPTPIQAQAIPAALEQHDVLGCAQTGTGKTAAFAIPILNYLAVEKPRSEPYAPKVLVLAPTRELAVQIAQTFTALGKHVRYRQVVIHGGVAYGPQINAMQRGVHVLVATPGRLIDLMDQKHVDLSQIEMLVVDEADRMLDMGFLPALQRLVRELPEERQSLFFSATMPPKIQELAAGLLFNPVRVTIEPPKQSLELISQEIRFVQREAKFDSLIDILNAEETDRTIVFTKTKHGGDGLVKKLEKAGFKAAAIHGNKTQSARQKALNAFRQRRVDVLVATDVAARGIDIDGVSHVVNFDLPVDPENYVHRIGRTGRAGASGTAISFCTRDETDALLAIEKFLKRQLLHGADREGLAAPARTARRRPRSGGSQPRSGGNPRASHGQPRASSGQPRGNGGTPRGKRRFGKGQGKAQKSST